MSASEFDNTFGAIAGWSSKSTSAGILFWGIIMLIGSCGAMYCLFQLPGAFLYGFSAVPGITAHPQAESDYAHLVPKASRSFEWALDTIGHIGLICFGVLQTMNIFGVFALIVSISVPVYLMFRYWGQDAHTENHAHY